MDSVRFVSTLCLCVRLYCATSMAGHLRVIYHSGSLLSLRPAPYGDGHTVECAVTTLFIIVYNYAQLFTIIARCLQFLAWPLLLCFCAELMTCTSVFSRHGNTRNLHPLAMLCNWRRKNSLLYAVCGYSHICVL